MSPNIINSWGGAGRQFKIKYSRNSIIQISFNWKLNYLDFSSDQEYIIKERERVEVKLDVQELFIPIVEELIVRKEEATRITIFCHMYNAFLVQTVM